MKINLEHKNLNSEKAFDDMFGINNNLVTYIRADELDVIKNQPFKPYPKEKLIELSDDIEKNGLLSPLVVRHINNRYQILSGRNRYNACILKNIVDIPCIVKDVDDNIADLILVNSNLNQRHELLHSEKAFAYKMQLNCIKKQGVPLEPLTSKMKSRDILSKKTSQSNTQIQRYIRLTYLIEPLLNRVDKKNLSFRSGVNISYLSKTEQYILEQYILESNQEISIFQSDSLKKSSKEKELTYENINLIFNPEKIKKEKKKKEFIKIKTSDIQDYIEDIKETELEEFIIFCIKNHRCSNGTP
ncbi:MAG: ParB/RepB/Spo0J family partition protein [Oscillospiraceae bacterium]